MLVFIVESRVRIFNIYNNVQKCFYMKEIYLDVFRSSKNICLFLLWQHLFLAKECHFKLLANFCWFFEIVLLSRWAWAKVPASSTTIWRKGCVSCLNWWTPKRWFCFSFRYRSSDWGEKVIQNVYLSHPLTWSTQNLLVV